jgi:hypothetical protein
MHISTHKLPDDMPLSRASNSPMWVNFLFNRNGVLVHVSAS